MDEGDEPARWQLGASWGGFDTDLSFDDGYEPRMRQHALSVSGTRILDKGWSLRLALGPSLGGSLGASIYTGHDSSILRPGLHGSFQASKRFRDAAGAAPFVLGSLALAGGATPVGEPGEFHDAWLFATDLRIGATAGWQVGQVWSPYLSAQLFGGPAFLAVDGFRSMGQDIHHYRLSVGSSFFLGDALSVFVDAAPVGERGLAAGLSYAL
jgi:hypothetical protein